MALNVINLYNSYTSGVLENTMVKTPFTSFKETQSPGNPNFSTTLTIGGTVSLPPTSTIVNTVTTGTTSVPIYRGFLAGNYVYQTGSPPGGATDITIVGYINQ
jgi:hypothetical protein